MEKGHAIVMIAKHNITKQHTQMTGTNTKPSRIDPKTQRFSYIFLTIL